MGYNGLTEQSAAKSLLNSWDIDAL